MLPNQALIGRAVSKEEDSKPTNASGVSETLEEFMLSRPTKGELQATNILHETTGSAAIAGAQKQLHFKQLSDMVGVKVACRPDPLEVKAIVTEQESLNDKLDSRPNKTDLVSKGIMRPDNVSSPLQQAQDLLKSQMIEDNIRQNLSCRKSKDALLSSGILKADNEVVSTILQSTQEMLKMQMANNKMSRKVSNRPERANLIDHNILKSDIVTGGDDVSDSLKMKLEMRPDFKDLPGSILAVSQE